MKTFIVSAFMLISLNSFACDTFIGKYVSCDSADFQVEIQKLRSGRFMVINTEAGKENETTYNCIKGQLVYKKSLFGNGFISTMSKTSEGISSKIVFIGALGEMIKDAGTVVPSERLCSF